MIGKKRLKVKDYGDHFDHLGFNLPARSIWSMLSVIGEYAGSGVVSGRTTTLRFRQSQVSRNLRDLRPPLLHVREEDFRAYLEAELSACKQGFSLYYPRIVESMLSVL